MHWFVYVLKKYAVFSGRAQRAEYWWFSLICLAIALLIGALSGMSEESAIEGELSGPGIVELLYQLGMLIPSIAVATRRLHDIDRSGWWQLLHLAVGVGTIVLLVWMIKSGTSGPNRFGEDPKEESSGDTEQPV